MGPVVSYDCYTSIISLQCLPHETLLPFLRNNDNPIKRSLEKRQIFKEDPGDKGDEITPDSTVILPLVLHAPLGFSSKSMAEHQTAQRNPSYLPQQNNGNSGEICFGAYQSSCISSSHSCLHCLQPPCSQNNPLPLQQWIVVKRPHIPELTKLGCRLTDSATCDSSARITAMSLPLVVVKRHTYLNRPNRGEDSSTPISLIPL